MGIKKTIITLNTEKGDKITSGKAINLTSVTKGALEFILVKSPTIKFDRITFIPIINNVVYDSARVRRWGGHGKRQEVIAFCDSDDRLIDIKIRQLARLQSIIVTHKVIITPNKIDKNMREELGLISRVTNYHNTKEVMDQVSATSLSLTVIKKSCNIMIVRTVNCFTDHFASILFAAQLMDKPYQIEKFVVKYGFNWMTKLIDKEELYYNTVRQVNQVNINDGQWLFKVGHADKLFTNTGSKYVTDKKPKDNKKKKWFEVLFDKIKTFIIKVVNKIFGKRR